MSAITDIKCVLSQKAFDAFCEKFHIPEETHPALPIVPTVGLFRCFYVNSKKSGWISFSKRSDNAPVCYTKPLDSLKNWNNHFFWVDDFACPVSFPWHTARHVTRDPAPTSANFNAQDYATLVAHPSPFRKFPEEFLCFVGLSRHYTLDEDKMDLLAFIHTPDPTKVKVVERERTTVGCMVPLLPVTPDLEASVDRLFDEGGSGDQMKQRVSVAKMSKEKENLVADAGGSSHPPKKLRDDHGTPSGPSVAGKSRSVVYRLLARAVLNAEVRGEAIPTLPFVTSFVFATPERKDRDHTDSVTRLNLRTVGSSQRFVISLDSSYSTNVAEAEVDSLIRSSVPVMMTVTTVTPTVDSVAVAKEKPVEPSLFAAASSSAGGTDPNPGGFSDHTVSVTNGSHLDDGRVCREKVDEFTPLKLFASVHGMKHDQLFTEFNVRAARQMSLSAEVRMRAEYNIKEKRRLKSVDEMKALKERNTTLEREKNDLDIKVTDLAASVAVREREVADLDALVHELEVSSSGLQEKVAVYEDYMGQLEKFQDDRMKEGIELAISKCLNSPEYLSALGAAIGKAIEKVMQDGLSARITHGTEVVVGATALSLALDVSNIRVRKIRENIANQRSALRDVFVPLSEPFSAEVLMGMEGTSNTMDATVNTTMALSTTIASAGTVVPISVDDYDVIGMDDQAVADENAARNAEPFPNVNDAELNIPQRFAKIFGLGRM
ncbi:hypothetical protein Tco_0838760 [Tanacetum coccineum]|uniref:Transposase (Putative), gypsy type n=1 Tax=Tanacetum coccineum TaxID=301880 RepID=A0ABQ5APN3_9ASTR